MLQEAEAAAEPAAAAAEPVAEAAASGEVTFPDDYPNSVKHVLLIGSMAFFIGAIVFLYLSMTRKKATVAHSLLFLSSAIAAMAYYSMWNGLGVEYKTTDVSPRVIFWSRHVSQLLTVPVSNPLARVCQQAGP